MTQSLTLSNPVEPVQFEFGELLVAYDFSEASESALKYAEMLSKRFGSHLQLLAVQRPAEYADALEGGRAARNRFKDDLGDLKRSLQHEGLWCDVIQRVGNIADTIEGAILEQSPDLLLLGAFGHGSVDRRRLGSTAEHLLRTIHCPTLVIGPQALLQEKVAPPIRRIICAMSTLDEAEEIPLLGGHLAKKLDANLELLHVVDPQENSTITNHGPKIGQQWLDGLHGRGISASCTCICGRADEQVAAHALASEPSLILFGLHRSGSQMVECCDGVVSATIRQARCPVMVIPPGCVYRPAAV